MSDIKLFHIAKSKEKHLFLHKNISLQFNKYSISLHQQARQASRRSSNRWAF